MLPYADQMGFIEIKMFAIEAFRGFPGFQNN